MSKICKYLSGFVSVVIVLGAVFGGGYYCGTRGNESEAEIEALRKYYNDIISDYNKIIKTIPSNIVAKLSKLKTKDYFDGKDLSENGKAVTKI